MVSVHVRVLLINGGSKQPDVLVKVPMRLVALKLVSPTQPVWRVSLLNFFSALSAVTGAMGALRNFNSLLDRSPRNIRCLNDRYIYIPHTCSTLDTSTTQISATLTYVTDFRSPPSADAHDLRGSPVFCCVCPARLSSIMGWDRALFLDPVLTPYCCAICDDVICEARIACRQGHTFCRSCLQQWRGKNSSCPCCRVAIEGECESTCP